MDVSSGRRILCWFSCGAASAVAAKIILQRFGSTNPCVPVYCDTSRNEHPDNARFMADCEAWFEVPVTKIVSEKFKTVEEVFTWKQYMVGIGGAPCTKYLKKFPRHDFAVADDIHVFGFTADEQKRIDDFELRNPDMILHWALREAAVTKQDCYQRLKQAGIRLPAMYLLGYKNNNCLGCVKATSPGYWAKVRNDFPEVFERRAQQSREVGARLVRVDGKRIFLDELPVDRAFKYKRENISCGPECGVPG
jgi:hypothetical protein